MNNLKDIATEYWRNGWNVIPVSSDKRPLVKWKEWTLFRESEDHVLLMPWDQAEGVAGITGLGYAALDVDKECLKKAKKFIEGLPKTRIHRTPSGGIHLIFKSKKACCSTDRLREPFGIEVQGIGNYIILPPSFKGKYKIENPETQIAEVDDLENLIYERAKALGWKEKLEGLSIASNNLMGISPYEVSCVRFFINNPFPESSRELTIGKNFAILGLSALRLEDIEPFAEKLTEKQPNFSKTDIISWLRWAREKTREFNCSEVSKFIQKYYPNFKCEDCPLQRITKEPKKNIKDYCSLEELIDYWHKNYYIEDDAPLIITLATAASNKLEGDPVWLMLVGPPSCVKTELIRSLGEEPSDQVWPISTLTVNTFLSGQGRAFSLLPKIDGKILTIKDFTSILQKEKNTRNEILSQLREIYDGYFSKGTGGEVDYQNVKSKVTVIAGVTQIVDLYEAVQGLLGERFLKVRVKAGDPKEVGKKASEVCGEEDEIRFRLKRLTIGFLNSIKVKKLEFDEKTQNAIIDLAIFIAKARTPVFRGYGNVVEYLPESEGVARLLKQLQKLAWGLAAVLGREKIDEDILKILNRVAVDTVDQRRIMALRAIGKEPIKTHEIAIKMNLPTETTRRILDDLTMIGLVVKEEYKEGEEKEYKWALKSDIILPDLNLQCIKIREGYMMIENNLPLSDFGTSQKLEQETNEEKNEWVESPKREVISKWLKTWNYFTLWLN
jgi:hypothetical protein